MLSSSFHFGSLATSKLCSLKLSCISRSAGSQPARKLPPYRFAQQHGYRIPDLAHRFAPCTFDVEAVREGLNSFRLAHREVVDAAIWIAEHVFSAGDTVASRLDGFSGPVDVAAGVAGVGARAVVEYMIADAVLGLRIGDAL